MDDNSIYTEDGKGYKESVCKLLHERMNELLSNGKTEEALPFSIALNERVLQLKNPSVKLVSTNTLKEELGEKYKSSKNLIDNLENELNDLKLEKSNMIYVIETFKRWNKTILFTVCMLVLYFIFFFNASTTYFRIPTLIIIILCLLFASLAGFYFTRNYNFNNDSNQ